MYCHRKNGVLIFTKDNTIKEIFRKLSCKFINSEILISQRLDTNTTNKYYIKIVFIDQSLYADECEIPILYNKIKHTFPLTQIITICEGGSNFKTFFLQGSDYIIEKPVNTELVEALLFKNLTELKEIGEVNRYHGITLHTQEDFAYYNDCKIFLSNIESIILCILISKRDFVSVRDLKILIRSKINIEISDVYLKVTISRLRNKLRQVSGLNLIKNKYSKGYHITI